MGYTKGDTHLYDTSRKEFSCKKGKGCARNVAPQIIVRLSPRSSGGPPLRVATSTVLLTSAPEQAISSILIGLQGTLKPATPLPFTTAPPTDMQLPSALLPLYR
jgi:hypothetical protein